MLFKIQIIVSIYSNDEVCELGNQPKSKLKRRSVEWGAQRALKF